MLYSGTVLISDRDIRREIDEGRITLDGIDTRTVPRAELRSHVGMVLQDTWLFGGTIYDNIAYGDPTASREEVLDAAKRSRRATWALVGPNSQPGSIQGGVFQVLFTARGLVGKTTADAKAAPNRARDVAEGLADNAMDPEAAKQRWAPLSALAVSLGAFVLFLGRLLKRR